MGQPADNKANPEDLVAASSAARSSSRRPWPPGRWTGTAITTCAINSCHGCQPTGIRARRSGSASVKMRRRRNAIGLSTSSRPDRPLPIMPTNQGSADLPPWRVTPRRDSQAPSARQMLAHCSDIGVLPFLADPWRLLVDHGLTQRRLGLGVERVEELIEQDRETPLLPLAILAKEPDGVSQRRRARAHSIAPRTVE